MNPVGYFVARLMISASKSITKMGREILKCLFLESAQIRERLHGRDERSRSEYGGIR